MSKKIKEIIVAGICANCGARRNCDFVMGIQSYIRDNKYAGRINDIEIAVYSCDNYESEVDKVCDENEMCVSCHQEE